MANYLSKKSYAPLSFKEMSEMRALMPGATEEAYQRSIDALQAQRGVEISDIVYDSDGLKVTGIEVLPKSKPNEKLPLIIYNRGGSGNFGMLNAYQIDKSMVTYAQRMRAGVLASNYRGNGGSEGREEWGGADLNDVTNLLELGKQQSWWDGKNIFMIGWSRGGMMTYLALKNGVQVNAAAVGAGAADLFEGNQRRPEMEKTCAWFIPNYEEQREVALTERSAVCWPEKINAPLLLLHGDADERVNVNEARKLYSQLNALEKPVKYVEFPGGEHGLAQPGEREKVTDEIVDWFEAHRVQEIDRPR